MEGDICVFKIGRVDPNKTDLIINVIVYNGNKVPVLLFIINKSTFVMHLY